VPWLKVIEVLGLLLALAAFVGWQWWDLKRAKEASAKQRLALKDAEAAPPAEGPEHDNK